MPNEHTDDEIDELIEMTEHAIAVPSPMRDPFLAIVERMATDPRVDVGKMEQVVAICERIHGNRARMAFDAAFAEMQPHIPEINEQGQITNRDGHVQSRYARNEDVQKALKPVLSRFGFALSFRTEWIDDRTLIVTGILTHRDGHSRESSFRSAADTSGAKNAVQALGSVVSYGHRYTTKDLCNVTSRWQGDRDDDAQTAIPERTQAPGATTPTPGMPDGYAESIAALESAAMVGSKSLFMTWNQQPLRCRSRITRFERERWDHLKEVAATADDKQHG